MAGIKQGIFKIKVWDLLWKFITFRLMLTNLYKRYFGILAKDKILFFGSGKVAFPSAAKLFDNYSNLHYVTHYTPER